MIAKIKEYFRRTYGLHICLGLTQIVITTWTSQTVKVGLIIFLLLELGAAAMYITLMKAK